MQLGLLSPMKWGIFLPVSFQTCFLKDNHCFLAISQLVSLAVTGANVF